MTLNLSACGTNEGNAEAKSLYAQGLEIVQLMSELTQSTEYVDFSSGDCASKGLKSLLTQKALGTLITQINGRSGMVNLAATGTLTDLIHKPITTQIHLYRFRQTKETSAKKSPLCTVPMRFLKSQFPP